MPPRSSGCALPACSEAAGRFGPSLFNHPICTTPFAGNPMPVESSTAYQSPTDRVAVWVDATTLHIRFNNPARHNALSVDMWQAIPPLLAQAEKDDAIRL